MIRHIAPCMFVALLSASLFACDKPGATEQQKEDKAVERATNARNEAEQQAQGAQAAAAKDVAAARAEFEKKREDYRHTRRSDLADLDKKIAEIEADARSTPGKTKSDRQARLPAIRAQRDAFVRDLESLDSVTPSSWDGAKANLDKEWDALTAAVDRAKR
jgi:chromosome segregation ATPase